MGLRLTVPGADFEDRAIGFTPAVPDGLKGLFFLNGSIEKAARNLVVGRSPASVAGAPVVGAGVVRMRSSVDFLQTDIPETAAMTVIAVAACPDTMADDLHRPMYVSNFGSPYTGSVPSFGAGLYVSAANRIVMAGSRFSNAEGTGATSASSGPLEQAPVTLSFLCGRTSNDRTEMNNLTQALSAAGNHVYPRHPALGAMRIGSGYSASFQGLSDIGFVAIYDRFITNTERDAIYAQIKSYFSRRFDLTI